MLTMEYIKENEKTYQVQIEELTNRVEYEQRRNQRKDKEIERLQEENLLLKASEPMSKLAEDYGYKTRCEKAIEYIENHSITNMEWWITGQQKVECKFMEDTNPQELLEILKGEDK